MSHPWRKPLNKDAIERWRTTYPAEGSEVATRFLKDAPAKAKLLRQNRHEARSKGGVVSKLRFDEKENL